MNDLPNPALLETLQNLIVPGKRVRLSPLVENAQFEVLMGEVPDDRRRAESAQVILNHRGNKEKGLKQNRSVLL